jgi:hypothetical protein
MTKDKPVFVPTYFIPSRSFTLQEVEEKLENLRKRWVNEPDKRKLIEVQASYLKRAIEMKKDKLPPQGKLI